MFLHVYTDPSPNPWTDFTPVCLLETVVRERSVRSEGGVDTSGRGFERVGAVHPQRCLRRITSVMTNLLPLVRGWTSIGREGGVGSRWSNRI